MIALMKSSTREWMAYTPDIMRYVTIVQTSTSFDEDDTIIKSSKNYPLVDCKVPDAPFSKSLKQKFPLCFDDSKKF